jgi:altronate dehydratase
MQGPGGDLESVTGLAASGATAIAFSTGRGTITGSALCPVIKLSSNSALAQRMPQAIDLDAGILLANSSQNPGFEQFCDGLFDLLLEVASGRRTWAERWRQRQFQIWTAGKLSL